MKLRLRLLLAACTVSFLLLLTLSVLSIVRINQLSERVNIVEHSYKVVDLINNLDSNMRELDKCAFRFLVTGDSAFFNGFDARAAEIRLIDDRFRTFTNDNSTQQDNIVLFTTDLGRYISVCRQAMADRRTMNDGLTGYPKTSQQMNVALQSLHLMRAEEDRLLNERTVARKHFQQNTSALITSLSIVFILLTLMLFYLLLREFRKRMTYQAELQQKVMEIAQSKQELEHIAFAISHHLQEPLRKIRILTDKWLHQQRDTITNESRDTLDRVVVAATRMQDLVGDLMTLTTLHDNERPMPCQLQEYVKSTVAGMSERIAETSARIEVDPLPLVYGYPDQLRLLFKNLLDNALKFTRPGISPVVQITACEANDDELGPGIPTGRKYYCITIRDNGIGFDNKTADKMFGIFRQLHTEKEGYTGKGTGLAICQRIMSNHKGRIIAHGFPGAGATFKLYFPIDRQD